MNLRTFVDLGRLHDFLLGSLLFGYRGGRIMSLIVRVVKSGEEVGLHRNEMTSQVRIVTCVDQKLLLKIS